MPAEPTAADVDAHISYSKSVPSGNSHLHGYASIEGAFLAGLPFWSHVVRASFLGRMRGITNTAHNPPLFTAAAAAVVYGIAVPEDLAQILILTPRPHGMRRTQLEAVPGRLKSVPDAELCRRHVPVRQTHQRSIDGFLVTSMDVTALMSALYDEPHISFPVVSGLLRALAHMPQFPGPSDRLREKERKDRLLSWLRLMPGVPRRRMNRARSVIELADGGCYNLFERETLHDLLREGVTGIESQVRLQLGDHLYVPDLYLRRERVAIEPDGRGKAVSSAALREEQRQRTSAWELAVATGMPVRRGTFMGETEILSPDAPRPLDIEMGGGDPDLREAQIHDSHEATLLRDAEIRMNGHGIVHIPWKHRKEMDRTMMMVHSEARTPLILGPNPFEM